MSGATKALVALVAALAIGTGGYFVAKVTTSTTSTSTTTSSSTTSTSTTTATASACQGNSFKGTLEAGQGAAGTIYTDVLLTNHGPSCSMIGWPSLVFFDPSSVTMSAQVVQSGEFFSGQSAVPTTPSSFTVAAHGTAKFSLAFSDVPVGSQQSCPTVGHVQVTLPNASASATVINVLGGGSLVLCGSGMFYISPLYP